MNWIKAEESTGQAATRFADNVKKFNDIFDEIDKLSDQGEIDKIELKGAQLLIAYEKAKEIARTIRQSIAEELTAMNSKISKTKELAKEK